MKYLKIFLIFLLFNSCRKDVSVDFHNSGKLDLQFIHHVDNEPFLYNFNYINLQNNTYEIQNLEYYISNIYLIRSDNTEVLLKNYQYVNPKDSNTLKSTVSHLPFGKYIGIKFSFGLSTQQNKKFGLDQNENNIGMEWPEDLGSGYHFLRFEGEFKDTANVTRAFVIHLGKSENRVDFKFYKIILIDENISKLSISMNINNWFNGQNDINLNDNYTSTMDDDSAQLKFKNNAASVFNIN